MPVLVILIIVIADGPCRNESIRPRFVKLHEQAGAGDAANPAFEGCADPVGEMMGDQTIDGLALGLHRPAFGRGNTG